ncbi:MAG: methyltransferase [Chthoniobacter sp.]|nr:methyltransferase [Chthoniobacter sp.]
MAAHGRTPETVASIEHWQEERRRLEREFGERITLDALTGPIGLTGHEPWPDDAGECAGWLIAQRKSGHRHSVDDVLTAWYALHVSPPVAEHLDLGTGIGTVGLLTLWGLGPAARLTCVEAQEISYRILQANLDANGLRHRVDSRHGDLRALALHRTFPLITGSPPYFPPGSGVLPQDTQKAHARFELRGDVRDYAKAAAVHLGPGGWLVLCFPSAQKQRALDGITAAGLKAARLRDVIPRETLPPLFTLFACQHATDDPHETIVEAPLTVRLVSGRLTEEMAGVRRVFGFADGEAHGGYGRG